MGAQWKHSIRQANNEKKSGQVGKIVKEIIVSAKLGGADPDSNFRLRGALEDARKHSVPRDTIERAVKRGAGLLDDPVQYETIMYEGFAPHQVPIIIECLTDNKNRTAADIRGLFRKGQQGSAGSVAWMFEHKGIVEAHTKESGFDLDEIAIECGADEVEKIKPGDGQPTDGTIARFTCALTELNNANKFLSGKGWNILSSEPGYIAKNFVSLNDEQMKEVGEFLGDIDDNDDVRRLYVGLKQSE